jgi:hypothetical protein
MASEHFNERLHIRPLQDGRVYTHFSFKTLLTGAVPRSPATLHVDDECELLRGMHCPLFLIVAPACL